VNGHGDEDRNKDDGDGEGETGDMGESLDMEKDGQYGTDRNLETTDVPTKEEVRAAVDKLKNKAPSLDGIPSEILKEGYKYTENRIYELKVQIWNKERIPLSWVEALICPIQKKGGVQN